MRHSLAATAVVLALFGLPGLATGGSATGPRATGLQKRAAGRIEALAMDGRRIAYDVAASGTAKRCNAVHVWDLRTGRTGRVSGKKTCEADGTSTGAGVRELALAGSRVAWIVNLGGNSERADYLYAGSVSGGGERRLAFAVRDTENAEGGGPFVGGWIGGLVGGGSFLGVNRWATDKAGTVTSARLDAVRGGLRTVARGLQTIEGRSSDGKLVAVLRADETVGVYSTAGKLLRTVEPSSPTEVAVRGDYLAVVTAADTVEVYNSHSGRRLHTWRVAHGARSLDLSSGFAAYAAPRTGGGYARVVHVLGLSSGRDRVLATTPPQLAGVRLEPAGLVYAVNRTGAREDAFLVFVPMSRLPR